MKVNCYQISEGPKLTPCEYSFAIEAIRQKKARIWIDLLDAETSELEEKLDEIKVQGLIRHLCLDSRDHPGFYPFQTTGSDGNTRSDGSTDLKYYGVSCYSLLRRFSYFRPKQ